MDEDTIHNPVVSTNGNTEELTSPVSNSTVELKIADHAVHVSDSESQLALHDGAELHVSELSFLPSKKPVLIALEHVRYHLTLMNLSWLMLTYKGPSRKELLYGAELHSVNFKAHTGELVAVLGNAVERFELVQLLVGRKKSGKFDGNISLSGKNIAADSNYYDHVGFVPQKALFVPGLTYYDMIKYAARLRMDASPLEIEERVQDMMTIMKIGHLRNKKIPEYPSERGEDGSELRRLSIAMELVHMPPVMVIDDPTWTFDPAIAVKLFGCLKELARRGHVVICSMDKPSYKEMSLLDRVVLLSEGYTIFNSHPRNVIKFFCEGNMGYTRKPGTDLTDFILDVCSGVERPIGERAALLPAIMQERFSESEFYEPPATYSESQNTHSFAFASAYVGVFGYGHRMGFISPKQYTRRAFVVMDRAVVMRVKDVKSVMSSLAVMIVFPAVVGYLQYGQGHFGRYANTFFGLAYASSLNCVGCIFLTVGVAFAFPFKDTHIFCQKLQLFRYERASRVCTLPAFLIATAVAEFPFFALLFFNYGTIVYFMTRMRVGSDNFQFWIGTIVLAGMVGVTFCLLLCALLKRELLVRDTFFVLLVFMVAISGFPVQQSTMEDNFWDLSVINPLRWTFESVVQWKFSWYEDGDMFLTTYSFNNWEHHKIFVILMRFLLAMFGMIILALVPKPSFLSRLDANSKARRDSRGLSRASIESATDHLEQLSAPPRMSTRNSELVAPLLFMRESTVTGRNSMLSTGLSQTGQENEGSGPTVLFKDITYRVWDPASPVGYKNVLTRCSGQFSWGKLAVIIGAPGSGKSSLLHILAGDVAPGTELTGKVLLNGKPVDPKLKPWEVCGFVPFDVVHHRDLTVLETIQFAMKLRCYNHKGLTVLQENVKNTIEILHLQELLQKKAKHLNQGQLKRLSIAEEIVHGPKLLYIDEPTTGVSLQEASVLLTLFREMVNNDRTVVMTCHQPFADAFKLFDTLMLLSKGRVIYWGSAKDSMDYFASSPFAYNFDHYLNPAEFLTDISGGHLSDAKGEFMDSSILENYYLSTDGYQRLRERIKQAIKRPSGGASGGLDLEDDDGAFRTQNPMVGGQVATATATGAAPRGFARDSEDVLDGGADLSMDGQVVNATSIDASDITSKHSSTIRSIMRAKRPTPMLVLALYALYEYMTAVPTFDDIAHLLFKRRILFHRAVLSLFKRFGLLLSSMVVTVLLASLFVWVIDDSNPGNVTATVTLGGMFVLFSNVQFVYYIFNSNKVFLREHTRGLYPLLSHYSSTSLPLYFLRAVTSVLFVAILITELDLPDSTKHWGFQILNFMAYFVASTAVCEVLIFIASSVNSGYSAIPAFAVFNFFVSGLFVKPQSLPRWLAPWFPSISVVRWLTQGAFIDIYDGDTDTFPYFPGTNYSNYIGFLNLFGWGGKTKWYCLGMVAICFVIFRVLALLGLSYVSFARRGLSKTQEV